MVEGGRPCIPAGGKLQREARSHDRNPTLKAPGDLWRRRDVFDDRLAPEHRAHFRLAGGIDPANTLLLVDVVLRDLRVHDVVLSECFHVSAGPEDPCLELSNRPGAGDVVDLIRRVSTPFPREYPNRAPLHGDEGSARKYLYAPLPDELDRGRPVDGLRCRDVRSIDQPSGSLVLPVCRGEGEEEPGKDQRSEEAMFHRPVSSATGRSATV
jgi:hypothetical protein